MSGRWLGSGFSPLRSVGARTHWPDDSSDDSEQSTTSQPLAAIHLAPGATPMSGVKGPGPSPPRMVPIVCVPWATLSHGAASSQSPVGSHQW